MQDNNPATEERAPSEGEIMELLADVPAEALPALLARVLRIVAEGARAS